MVLRYLNEVAFSDANKNKVRTRKTIDQSLMNGFREDCSRGGWFLFSVNEITESAFSTGITIMESLYKIESVSVIVENLKLKDIKFAVFAS